MVPLRRAWLVCTIRFDSESIMASTCDATASALPPVWFTTSTPASVQSLTLTVSKPAPVGGNDEQIRHTREQIALDMEARLELVACRSDLVDVRGRHDRPGSLVGGFVLE